MNARTLIPLAAGLGIGGFALWMGFDTLKRAQGTQQAAPSVQLWAAKADIPRGTEITEELIQKIPFPAKLVPKGAIQESKDLVGRVPRLDAPAGLPILEDMLLPAGTKAGIYVKHGYRAVALKIDESSGVDYHLEPGSFVDVVGSFSVRRDGGQETLAATIVENVEVAAVGPRLSTVSNGKEGDEKSKDRMVRAITLFVKPEDVPKLLLAEQKGRIKLSLRNDKDGEGLASHRPYSDTELTGEKPAKAKTPAGSPGPSFMDQLRSAFAKPDVPPPKPLAATPAPPAPSKVWQVDVYRGQNRQVMRFKNRDSRDQVEENKQKPQNPEPGADTPTTAPAPAPESQIASNKAGNPDEETEPKEPVE